MNQGTVFFAPFNWATANRGFCTGLEPPASGCEWQEKHWFELKRGPRPLFEPLLTTSISANLACPSRKNAVSSAVRPCSGPPAPAAPPRTPGSTGAELVWPKVQPDVIKTTVSIPLSLLGVILPSVLITSPHRFTS